MRLAAILALLIGLPASADISRLSWLSGGRLKAIDFHMSRVDCESFSQ